MEELFRESESIGEGYFAITLARYDPETGVLVVDQQGSRPDENGGTTTLEHPTPRRVLETFTMRSAALRHVVELADQWIGIVRNGVAQ